MVLKYNELETYGKQGIFRSIIRETKDRFKTPKYALRILKKQGLEPYTPSVDKKKFIFGVIGILGLIVTPVVTPLSLFVFRWMIK